MEKRGVSIAFNELAYWIIGIAVLIGFGVLAYILINKDTSAIDLLKSFIKFR